MEAKRLNKVTLKEYLAIEKERQQKYEFQNGFIYAMAGGTYNHGLICGNIFGELRTRLKTGNQDCRAMTSEIKLHVESENSFLYPDAMVVCGEVGKSNKDPNAVINPLIVFEVLSKSTATYDRGDKFFMYRQIPSLQEYVLIEQEKPQLEIYKREGDLWQITRITGLDKKLTLPALQLEIPLTDIYEGVVFEVER